MEDRKTRLLAIEHYNLARSFDLAGQMNEAIHEYRAALQLDPNYHDARENLGNALLTTGDVDGAIVEYNAYVKAKPDSSSLLINTPYGRRQPIAEQK